MKLQTCYLDLDGVCADFHLEAVRAHLRIGRRFPILNHHGAPIDLTHDQLYSVWPRGTSCHKFCVTELPDELPSYWDPIMDGFWQPIRTDPFFWSNMQPYRWTHDLIKMLLQYCEEVAFVTSPDSHRNSHGGKFDWLVRNKLQHIEYITAHKKYRLAHPRDILIDDHGPHITKWLDQCEHRHREQGHALLFPQPWNSNYPFMGDRLGYIENYLKGYCG